MTDDVAMRTPSTPVLDDEVSRDAGIRLLEAGPTHVTLGVTAEDRMLNGAGVVHGGWIFLLADTAFGLTALRVLPGALTESAGISYHRPVLVGDELVACSTVVNRTRSTVLIDVTVSLAGGSRVASFRGSGRAPAEQP